MNMRKNTSSFALALRTRVRAAMLLIAMLCVAGGAWADQITPEEALQQAQDFLINRTARKGQASGTTPQLVAAGEISGLYVFNTTDKSGFVIVSNDDATYPILGFSESGSLDPSNIPSNMRAWLQGYADEIAWLQKQSPKSRQSGQRRAARRVGTHSTNPIAPLISTTWDQTAPYNNLCPMYSSSERAVTGCVATAMAQVMYYHQWPQSYTSAIPGYTTLTHNIDLTDGLPITIFNWDKMRLSYSDSYSEAEANAVATLMQYCGYSVQMNYGEQSGASTYDMASALKTYFDYGESTQAYSREPFSEGDWADLIYNELANQRPVVYSGHTSDNSGHAFVCDGYKYESGNDYFHINWGWSGTSDNYFLLSALDPETQGTGGSSSNLAFNYDQVAVIGIQKSNNIKITATEVGPHSAKLSWTGEGDCYNVRYRKASFFEDFENGLSQWTVYANGEPTGGAGWYTFNSNSNGVLPHSGDYVASAWSWNGESYNADNWLITPRVKFGSTLKFWVCTHQSYHDSYEVKLSTGGNAIADFTVTLQALAPAPANGNWNEVTIDLSAYTGQKGYIAIHHKCYNYNYLFIDDFSIEDKSISSEWENTSSTVPRITLTGLDVETTYEVQVQTINAGETSEWSASGRFTTTEASPVPTKLTASNITPTTADITWMGYGDSYNVRYRQTASKETLFYQDFETNLEGWTGNNLDGNSGIYNNLGVDESKAFAFRWTTNTPQYLISPELTNIPAGAVFNFQYRNYESNYRESFKAGYSTTTTDISAFTWSEEVTVSADTNWHLYEMTLPAGVKYVSIQCTSNDMYYCIIDNISIENVIPFDWTEITATEEGITLTGLTPETTYEVQVQAVNTEGISDWSSSVTFTTMEANPAPTDLSVTPYPTEAEVSWNGFADAYDIEWAELVPNTPSGDALWLQYDDDTYATNIGSNDANTWTWGVMYPASMLQDYTYLYKVGIYENSYYTMDSYTVNIYIGGDDAPGTLVGTQTVIPTAAGMHDIELSSPVTIDPDQNLWITATAYGTLVMVACRVAEPNNQWVLNGSTWRNIGDLASTLAGYGWMIRGLIDNTNPSYDWNTASGIASPYTITGLEAEKDYILRVKALYGEDGESEWTYANFTTPAVDAAPINLTADATATTATLSWTGYQDSYNVQYRIAENITETFFFDDFEAGLGQWTITAGEGATHPTSGIWLTYDPSDDSHSGTYCASSWSWYNNTAYQADNWLITPQVTFGGTLRFWVRTNSSWPDSYEVLLSTGGNATSDFTVLLQAMAAAPDNGQWNVVNIDLSTYAGQQGYIAIHHQDNDNNYLLIDDFGIYNLSYPGEWISASADESPLTITDLIPETEYEWQVQGNLTEGTTEWSEPATFTTLEGADILFAKEGYATYYNSKKDVVLPAGMKAYVVAKGLGKNKLDYVAIADGDLADAETNVVPKATAVMLQVGASSGDQTITVTLDSPTAPAYEETNCLWGSDTKRNTYGPGVPGTTYYYYKLCYSIAGDEFGWYFGTTGGDTFESPAHKAWLVLDFDNEPALSKFALPGHEDPTGILSVAQGTTTAEGWYTINGMKLDKQPTSKGLYIHNGKKVVVE